MEPPKKQHWLDRSIEVRNFHISRCRAVPDWNIKKTAELLGRSFGSVAQDILVASYVITHEKQLRKFKTYTDALEFVRGIEKQIKLREIT